MPIDQSAPPGPRRLFGQSPRRAAVASGVAALLVGGVLSATSASAAVPAFPDNLVVFPDRDFVTVEGFQDHLGETATLRVTRGGTVVGSAQHVVDAGDVAFEVNHPGGACWGAGTTLKVTPDIVAGDKVTISFPNGETADTTVQDAAVTADAVLDGSTVRVTGKLGSAVDRGQLEQRIVNPDLVPLVGKRDVRALPGPLVTAPGGAYQSGLQISTDGSFTATYVFDSATAARTAAASGGERLMSWQLEDADGNRQGLSIAEHGELGGPGMGGCPAGPADQAAPAASFSVVRSADNTQAQVTWTPAEAQAGAATVTGYQALAVGPENTSGTAALVGARTAATATSTTLKGLDPAATYTYEVRSQAGPRMSEPFTRVSTTPTGTVPADQTQPRLVVTPAPGSDPTTVVETKQVTASSETGADLYYAVGTSAVMGDLPSDAAKIYTGPIPITQLTELHFAAFDAAGNTADVVGTYTPPVSAPTRLEPPSTVTAAAGQESATVSWSVVTGAAGYRVTATPPSGTTGGVRTTEVTALRTTLSGLTAGVEYRVTVATQNSAGSYGEESAAASVTPNKVVDRVAITSARWKAGEFRVVGTGSAVGATMSVRTGSATGPVVPGATAVVTAPVAPATLGDYSVRVRNGAAPTANPGTIWVTSSNGGVAGPFTVANG